jgi:beta-N-acetylhexosaminidase
VSLERLAGSLFWVGFDGVDADDAGLDALLALAPGGIVLFGRNVTTPEATAALCAGLRERLGPESGTVPLIALDQEGGRVTRLGRGFATFPSALALGAAGNVALAERAGLAMATEIRRAGAEVDFAPVLDLLLEPAGTVIGTRALGDDPARTGPLGAALARGLQAGGVASVLKHFPGHGASAVDSHLALPRIETDAETLRVRELAPFAAGIAVGALGVMAGHLMVPALDALRPATTSRRILHDLLRDELGFGGLCFTDCLLMDALSREPGTVAAAVDALEAGADALTISHDLVTALAARDAIVAAVRSGRLALSRLEEAHERGLTFRRKLDALAATRAVEPDPAGVARLVGAGAVALVRGDPVLDPGRVLNLVSFESEATAADGIGSRAGASSLHVLLRERKIRAESLRVPLDPPPELLAVLSELLAAQGERRVAIVARRAHLFPAQARAIDALLEASPDAMVIVALEPFDVPRFPQARTVLCTFGDDATTFEALADILAGRAEPHGSVPVTLR